MKESVDILVNNPSGSTYKRKCKHCMKCKDCKKCYECKDDSKNGVKSVKIVKTCQIIAKNGTKYMKIMNVSLNMQKYKMTVFYFWVFKSGFHCR